MTSEHHLTDSAAAPQEPAAIGTLDLEQRLLAEAVRLHEDAQGPLEEPSADTAGRLAGGDLEQRILVRAHALSIAPAMGTALLQLRSASTVVVTIALVFATLAGASTAQLTLGSEIAGPVNFFWVLGGMLGIHTLALFIWLAMFFFKPSAVSTSSLGGLALAAGRRITHWLHRGPLHMAAIRASALVYGGNGLGRWTISAISHGLWLAFLTGCGVMVILILSIKQYNFAWETTILSDRTYAALTRTIAIGPDALGFSTPSAEQIAASHWDRQNKPSGETRKEWSGLLIGSIIAYGLLPRLLLLAFSVVGWRRASKRFRLDTSKRGYARLQTRLQPVARAIGVVDADTLPHGQTYPQRQEHSFVVGDEGPAAIVGFEIDPPETAWPPPIDGVVWQDLGFVDDRSGRQRVLHELTQTVTPPRLILFVCSLTVTPDRGTRTFIDDLQQVAQIPVALLLTDGQRLRERGDPEQLKQRIGDWRELGIGAQVAPERIIELDFEHLTDTSRKNLAALLADSGTQPPPGLPHQLEQAFKLVNKQVEGWSAAPDVSAQAELHRAIAQLYQGESTSWQTLLKTRPLDGHTQLEQLKTGAERMVDLLPARLRLNPRWLAAGAMAGALSCVAAATIVAPAAIAALPAWAGLGAAITTVVRPIGKDSTAEAMTPTADFGTAVQSAALFALLLELQGRDESTITQLLDQILATDEAVLSDAEAVRHWLDELHQRFDRVVAAEGLS
ncbi:MAG: DUF2868 domain-containing protein [Candidatus Competibacteraceae bacterium]|jgi:hypothetical protein|nr:DUF2868 domain-containing protein [Candidatus Competibacteraceae bacterium]